MKNSIYLFLISWISIQLLPAQNMIPNADFENWTADTLFHIWEGGYTTSNTPSYFYTGSPNVVSVPAPFGQAVHLATNIAGTDTVVGELVLGAFCPTGFLGGIPFSATPDSLVAWVKYDVTSPDNASIVLVFKANEMPVAVKYFPLNGSQPNYIRKAWALNLPGGTPAYDQLAMVISSGNKDHLRVGSWMEIDSIAFTGSSQQFVNPSFNEVNLLHYEDPDGWASPNISLGLFGSTVGISKSTDAYSGMYAARIEMVAFVSNCEPDTFGFMGEGTWDKIDGQDGGQPFAMTSPQMALGGYYKYEAVGNDTAMVGLLFTHYNTATAERDTVHGIIVPLAPTSSYEKFEIRFEDSDFTTIPDSFHLVFQASDPEHFASQGVRGDGSTLWIDALEMYTTVGIADASEIISRLYPNPATDEVRLKWDAQAGHSYEIRLLDIQGKSLIQSISNTGEIQLDIAKLPAGLYFVNIKDQHSNMRSSQKLLKK